MVVARNLIDERKVSSGSNLKILPNGFLIEPRGDRSTYFRFEGVAILEFDGNDSTMRVVMCNNSDTRWGWYSIERGDFTRLVERLDAYRGSEGKTALKVE